MTQIEKAKKAAIDNIGDHLDAVAAQLNRLVASADADPTNWGKVGDLQRLASMLSEIANAY